MKWFQSKIEQTSAGVAGDKVLVIVTDDEWDLNDLPLSFEVPTTGKWSDDDKKKDIIKFAKSKFAQILPIIIPKPVKFNRSSRNTQRAEDAEGIWSIYKHMYISLRAMGANLSRV